MTRPKQSKGEKWMWQEIMVMLHQFAFEVKGKEIGLKEDRWSRDLTDQLLAIFNKHSRQREGRLLEEIEKTKNHFKGMKNAEKQYHAAEHMKYLILSQLKTNGK